MDAKKILVPYNFTRHDNKVLDYIAEAYVGEKSVKITVFHLYIPIPKISTLNPAISNITKKMGGIIKELGEKEEEFKKLKDSLLEKGFLKEQIEVVFRAKKKNIGRDIVDMAKQGHYNIIILSHTPGKKVTYSYYTENVHARLISSLKDVEIIILT